MSQELKVEMVKKGDVLFYLESKISLFETLLSNDEKSQVDFMDNNILKEWTYSGKKGLNYIPYHLDVENVKEYEDWLAETTEDPVKLEKADTGKIYLQKGDYTIRSTKGGQSKEGQFSIQS